MRKIYHSSRLQILSRRFAQGPLMRVLAALSSGLWLSSCASVVPQTLHTPLLVRQGQADITAATGLHGTGLQAAYAATDHLALTASGQQRIRSKRGDWAYAGEIGAGRLWHASERHHWAVYGGLGYGAGYARESSFVYDAADADRVRYVYAYVQPTYALVKERSYGLSFAVKISQYHYTRWIHYYQSLSLSPDSGPTTQTTTEARHNRSMTMVQPGMNFYLDMGRHFRLLLTNSVAIPVQQQVPQVAWLATGIGLQYHFGGQQE